MRKISMHQCLGKILVSALFGGENPLLLDLNSIHHSGKKLLTAQSFPLTSQDLTILISTDMLY